MIFLKTNKNKIILITVTLILVIFMVLSSIGKEKAGVFSDTFGFVISPVQKAVTYVSDALSYGAQKDKFSAENNLLKQQLVTARKRAEDYDELLRENQSLRAMLELQKTSKDFEFKAADIIATDTNNWSSTLRLNKGLSSGIKKNDAVITEAGLVGYISNVGRTWADVTTIIDTSSSVSVIVPRTDDYCMLQGDISLFPDNLCSMKYASNESSLSTGDVLETSGEGGIYPSGIQVGKITEITPNTDGISQDCVIKPFVDFKKLNTVLVIVN